MKFIAGLAIISGTMCLSGCGLFCTETPEAYYSCEQTCWGFEDPYEANKCVYDCADAFLCPEFPDYQTQ